jgi:hypothetical protein
LASLGIGSGAGVKEGQGGVTTGLATLLGYLGIGSPAPEASSGDMGDMGEHSHGRRWIGGGAAVGAY